MKLPRNFRLYLQTLIGFLISIFFLVIILKRVHFSDLIAHMQGIQYSFLVLAILNKSLAFIVLTLRWNTLLKGIQQFAMRDVLKAVLYGFTLNNLLPFRIGELFRLEYLAEKGHASRVSCLTTIFVERLLDLILLASLFYILVSHVVLKPGSGTYRYVVLLAPFCFVMLALMLWQREKFLQRINTLECFLGKTTTQRMKTVAGNLIVGASSIGSKTNVFKLVAATVAYWLINALSVKLYLLSFGYDLPFSAPFVILLFVSFGVMIPAAPGFIGTYHYFCITALTVFGISYTSATSFCIVAHAAAILPYTLVGSILLLHENVAIFRRALRKKIEIN